MKIIILAMGFQPITNGELFWMNNNIIVIIEFSFCMMWSIKHNKENVIGQGR